MNTQSVGTNVQAEIRDGKLVIICDVDAKTVAGAEPSKSGKSRVVASTHGFTRLAAFGVSLNVTTGK